MRRDGAEGEIVDISGRRGLPKVAVALGLMVVLLVALVLGGRSWYQRQVDPPGPPGAEVDVVVPTGARLADLGSLLGDADVVANGLIFRFWIRNQQVNLQAGTYRFQENSSFEEVKEVLEAGPLAPPTVNVTVPEGLILPQIAARLADGVSRFTAEEVDAALADPSLRSTLQPEDQASLEGMLFPATYQVGPQDTPLGLLRRMLTEMEDQARAVGIERGLVGDDVPRLTPYEIVIVASLIERETGNREESPKIARVIYNRLLYGPQRGVPTLGIDATTRYYADLTGEPFDPSVDSPYNTGIRPGLPPTPIAAPGRASLEAALNPAVGQWLYYVLEEEGKHYFTSDYDDFLAAKQRCEQRGLGCG